MPPAQLFAFLSPIYALKRKPVIPHGVWICHCELQEALGLWKYIFLLMDTFILARENLTSLCVFSATSRSLQSNLPSWPPKGAFFSGMGAIVMLFKKRLCYNDRKICPVLPEWLELRRLNPGRSTDPVRRFRMLYCLSSDILGAKALSNWWCAIRYPPRDLLVDSIKYCVPTGPYCKPDVAAFNNWKFSVGVTNYA